MEHVCKEVVVLNKGRVALQNDFVSRDELVAATGVWLTDKERAEALIRQNKYDLAYEQVKLILNIDPRHPWALDRSFALLRPESR